jgi:hypothetical protein
MRGTDRVHARIAFQGRYPRGIYDNGEARRRGILHGPDPRVAAGIDIPAFAPTLRKGLTRLSYIGMTEPALHVNIAPGTRWSGKRAVSWHVHAICFGEDREQMRKRFARLNQQEVYRSDHARAT